jgi:hypothetical protein
VKPDREALGNGSQLRHVDVHVFNGEKIAVQDNQGLVTVGLVALVKEFVEEDGMADREDLIELRNTLKEALTLLPE